MRKIKTFKNKTILITGASSGIGKAAALKLARKGATVILVARREELLKEVVGEIHLAGGTAHWYAGDLSKIEESLERYHDFERCMDINYFAPVRLIRNLLPALKRSKSGHIINSTTWGTLLPVVGFGPYNASKIALDSMANSLRMEMETKGISVTQIHFPLVHTAMSGATKSFRKLPGMTPEQAGEWIVTAVKKKPRAIMDMKTRVASGVYFCFPSTVEKISRMLPFSI